MHVRFQESLVQMQKRHCLQGSFSLVLREPACTRDCLSSLPSYHAFLLHSDVLGPTWVSLSVMGVERERGSQRATGVPGSARKQEARFRVCEDNCLLVWLVCLLSMFLTITGISRSQF